MRGFGMAGRVGWRPSARSSAPGACRWIGVAALAGLLVGLATDAGSAEQPRRKRWWQGESAREAEPFHHRARLRAGGTLEIHGINGDIRATLAGGDEVVVDAVRRGRRDDPEDVRIEVTETRNGLVVCARYPTPTGDLNECDGRQNVENNDVSVHFTIQVPAGARFVPSTVNGSIRATGLEGPVEANTVNGGIEISTSGSAEAHTVNGTIEARLGSLGDDAVLEFETVNGGIDVAMPENAGVTVDARTANGSVHCDLPIETDGRSDRRRLSGRIGDGAARLRLSTVNGSIHIASI